MSNLTKTSRFTECDVDGSTIDPPPDDVFIPQLQSGMSGQARSSPQGNTNQLRNGVGTANGTESSSHNESRSSQNLSSQPSSASLQRHGSTIFSRFSINSSNYDADSDAENSSVRVSFGKGEGKLRHLIVLKKRDVPERNTISEEVIRDSEAMLSNKVIPDEKRIAEKIDVTREKVIRNVNKKPMGKIIPSVNAIASKKVIREQKVDRNSTTIEREVDIPPVNQELDEIRHQPDKNAARQNADPHRGGVPLDEKMEEPRWVDKYGNECTIMKGTIWIIKPNGEHSQRKGEWLGRRSLGMTMKMLDIFRRRKDRKQDHEVLRNYYNAMSALTKRKHAAHTRIMREIS